MPDSYFTPPGFPIREYVDKVKAKLQKPAYPLELTYSGNRLQIRGYAIQNSVTLIHHQSEGSGLLLEPIFKACKAHPIRWHGLKKTNLMNCIQYADLELRDQVTEVLNNPTQFQKYLNRIGLKGPVKKLFIAKTKGGLGIKFRLAVTDEEWNDLPKEEKKIVKRFLEIPPSKKIVS